MGHKMINTTITDLQRQLIYKGGGGGGGALNRLSSLHDTALCRIGYYTPPHPLRPPSQRLICTACRERHDIFGKAFPFCKEAAM